MASYQAPIRDMQFVLKEMLQAEDLLSTMPDTREVTGDLIDAILGEAGKVAGELFAPLNRSGDEQGCGFDKGEVTTPEGFREAYRTFAEGGWIGLGGDVDYGGQGMPKMLAVCFEEMIMGANTAFALYPVLSAGATVALSRHGNEELKRTYLPRLYEGRWSATMCLTEAHAGTDLGLLRTRAEPRADGGYRISGSKMFTTGGEHDLTENIIHLVLARLPDAPAGTKGLSLFLVPKYLPDSEGNVGQRNGVSCGSIEEKMGIHGSSTCVINFDEAMGYLVGEANRGLPCMFTMMNYERLTIGLQGLGLAEASYQTAAAYARERLQGRHPDGPQAPGQMADPLIVHPDVRRMLLTMRANTEAGRALAGYVATQLDLVHFHPDPAEKERAEKLVALLTPVTKAAFTDRGFEACVLGQQVLGGHGYVREWGQEQYVRDARIAQIYEGTNGIQALDLTGRKMAHDRAGNLEALAEDIRSWLECCRDDRNLADYVATLEEALQCLLDTSEWIRDEAGDRPAEVGAAATPYMELMALVLYGFMWLRMLRTAGAALERVESGQRSFYEAKLHTGHFFFKRLMPRYRSLAAEITSGSDVLMRMDPEQF